MSPVNVVYHKVFSVIRQREQSRGGHVQVHHVPPTLTTTTSIQFMLCKMAMLPAHPKDVMGAGKNDRIPLGVTTLLARYNRLRLKWLKHM